MPPRRSDVAVGCCSRTPATINDTRERKRTGQYFRRDHKQEGQKPRGRARLHASSKRSWNILQMFAGRGRYTSIIVPSVDRSDISSYTSYRSRVPSTSILLASRKSRRWRVTRTLRLAELRECRSHPFNRCLAVSLACAPRICAANSGVANNTRTATPALARSVNTSTAES